MPWPIAEIAQTDPLLRELFERAEAQGMGMMVLAGLSGVPQAVLWKCRAGKHAMRLASLAAAVEAMGGTVQIEWSEKE